MEFDDGGHADNFWIWICKSLRTVAFRETHKTRAADIAKGWKVTDMGFRQWRTRWWRQSFNMLIVGYCTEFACWSIGVACFTERCCELIVDVQWSSTMADTPTTFEFEYANQCVLYERNARNACCGHRRGLKSCSHGFSTMANTVVTSELQYANRTIRYWIWMFVNRWCLLHRAT